MKAIEHDSVAVVGPGQTYEGGQGFTYGAGCSAETVGATSICLSILPMPAGAVAKAHYHEGIKTITFLLEGTCKVYYGDDLGKSVEVQAGEQCFVAASVPHAPRNESGAPCTGAVAHSSGSDQDGLILTPDLDVKLAARFA
ncbi:MAG: cupin domain-containing protein [Paracoccaceae bacterium]|nr:cupin domain-containing protein [Paracoccaceae bacterium]